MEKPFAITLDVGSSLANKTGSWRTERPVYLDRLPPCNNACPAGENIQEWLRLIKEDQTEAAWRQLTRDNPFPAIHGRVCYHPCETACNRLELDSAVSISTRRIPEVSTSSSPGSPTRIPLGSVATGPAPARRCP